MSVEKVRKYLEQYGFDGRIQEFDVSSATVELAAQALGCDGARIAKTISFEKKGGGCILVVAAGDVKIDNRKFKDRFAIKPKMLSHEEALARTGHAVGGVCPFALKEGVRVYLDVSLKRFETVFPAAGSSNSAVEMTVEELYTASGALSFEDLCKEREAQA
jgi:prolyl-tRNA editing enzyme YbaK/EbsC (Cys-tRNA(Pro) deacylase)